MHINSRLREALAITCKKSALHFYKEKLSSVFHLTLKIICRSEVQTGRCTNCSFPNTLTHITVKQHHYTTTPLCSSEEVNSFAELKPIMKMIHLKIIFYIRTYIQTTSIFVFIGTTNSVPTNMKLFWIILPLHLQ